MLERLARVIHADGILVRGGRASTPGISEAQGSPGLIGSDGFCLHRYGRTTVVKDRYVFFEAAAKTHLGRLTDVDANLLSAMVAFAHSQSRNMDDAEFAAEAIATLSTHPVFARLDRVCLAQLAPGAPMLSVLGSANRRGLPHNAIQAGYHCFIADGSSLTRVEEGWMRAFPDAREVVAWFIAAGMPPQRTIRLVAESGLRAGLCLPLRLRNARGYLFMNSTEVDAFARVDAGVSMALTLLAQIARSRLIPVEEGLAPAHPVLARPLDPDRCTAAVIEMFRRTWGCEPAATTIGAMPVLWCQEFAMTAIRVAVETLAVNPALLRVSLREGGERHVHIEVADATSSAPGATLAGRCAAASARLAPWAITCTQIGQGQGLDLAIPADRSFHVSRSSAVCYSI